MNTSYIYSVSRVSTLGEQLLTKTDIDRLLVAPSADRLQTALKETYLAPYVLAAPEENMPAALEATLIEAKKLIHKIAPNGDMFRVLWVQYDIHNLRVLAKGAHDTSVDIEPYMSARGIYDPAVLRSHAEAGTLSSVRPGWQEAYELALKHVAAKEIDRVDAVFDALLFETLLNIAKESSDDFIKAYVTEVIDWHNCRTRLRVLALPASVSKPAFITGGSITAESLQDIDAVASVLEQKAPGFFTAAIESYQATGNVTQLEARGEDYLISFAKDAASSDMYSAASLVYYYLRVRQAAANVRTIVVGRNSGMDEAVIRTNLRLAYVKN